jgi:hypothetical protein
VSSLARGQLLSFTIAADPHQRRQFLVRVPSRTSYLFCFSQVQYFPNLDIQVPYLYIPGTGWPSYTSKALGSLFVAYYGSQGYAGVFPFRPHGINFKTPLLLLDQADHDGVKYLLV